MQFRLLRCISKRSILGTYPRCIGGGVYFPASFPKSGRAACPHAAVWGSGTLAASTRSRVGRSLALAAQALTLSVKDVKIAQRYPWNGLVDIDYTVVCDEPATNIWVYPVGYDADFNVSVAPRTLEGDGANGQPVMVGAEGEKTFPIRVEYSSSIPATSPSRSSSHLKSRIGRLVPSI